MAQSNGWAVIYYSRASGDIFHSKNTSSRASDIQNLLKKSGFKQASEYIFFNKQ